MWFLVPPRCKNGYLQDGLQSEKEIQRILEEIASEGDDDVLSESDKSSESESDSEIEDPVEKSESSDSDTTLPPLQKITKEEGWKWNVTGDRPSKLHFTGNPGIKPAIIRNFPPEPNPLEVFQLMVHDSMWAEIATATNRFAVQFSDKNPNSPPISQWFPTTSHEIKAYCALCVLMSQVKKPNLRSYWSIRKSLHPPFFRVYHTTKKLYISTSGTNPTSQHNRGMYWIQ